MNEPADLSSLGTAFRLKVTLAEAVPHPAWRRAGQAALDVVRAGRPVLLLGPPGSGKTLLLQDIARRMREAGSPVRFFDPGGARVDGSKGEILLVDEAGSLGAPALADLAARQAPFVLAALPASAAGLTAAIPALVPVPLDPLTEDEVADFVAARLSAAGQPSNLLEPGAVRALALRSGGLLRLVNTLGGAATFLAGMDGAAQVTRRHVEEAGAMREGAALPLPSVPAPMAIEATATLPAPQAEAAARPALSQAGATGRRRARALGAIAALAVLAVLSGLALLGASAPEGPARPQTYDTVPYPVPPSEPAPAEAAPRATPPATRPRQPRAEQAAEAAPPLPAPRDAGAGRVARTPAEGAATFRGTVFNETLRQGGRLMLSIRPAGQPGAVSVRFEASSGLIGSGELFGTLDTEGHLAASGTLLMGRNPHDTELRGTISGNSLSGAASFQRPAMATGRTRSTFRLARE